jgi:hypothetical protein
MVGTLISSLLYEGTGLILVDIRRRRSIAAQNMPSLTATVCKRGSAMWSIHPPHRSLSDALRKQQAGRIRWHASAKDSHNHLFAPGTRMKS